MLLLIILGVVVLLTFAVIGSLFFFLSREKTKLDDGAVPLTDLNQIKKEFSSGLLEPQTPKMTKLETDLAPPVYEPKVSIPTAAPAPALSEDDRYKQRAQDLEDELKTITQKAEDQSHQAQGMIEDLTKENESLKIQQIKLEEAQRHLSQLQDEASQLKTDNAGLQSQLDLAHAQVKLLQEQMAAFQSQMQEEISRANAAVTQIKQEKEALLAAPKPDPDGVLRLEIEDLKAANQKLLAMVDALKEKNEALQYALIKSRAQSSGLERVSFNYKNQLEDFLKKVNALQQDQAQLSQVNNRMEGLIQQVQNQNEDLVKKDQLSQFELEKNRSRLASLERECEDLKSRIKQQNNP